jgi:CheY-like chemotaxis protein
MVSAMKNRVLVIDDVYIILDLVEFMLQQRGYEVFTAINGLTALERIETTKPDLILLDLYMPLMDGYEFITQLRRCHNHYQSIPIILLTTYKLTLGEIEQLGVVGHLRKPFHQTELLSKLKSVLE